MGTEKRYWTGMEELHGTKEFMDSSAKEFKTELPVEEFVAGAAQADLSSGRRDFLKFLGFSVGAATLAACETPVVRAIPYVIKPEQVTPGMPTYYASTFHDGFDYGSILVKTREGRPIYIKGNKDHGHGSLNARINASVLSLYDSTRLTGPRKGSESTTWASADEAIKKALIDANAASAEVVLLTEPIASPSTLNVIAELKANYPSANISHVPYAPVSFEAMSQAYGTANGTPYLDFKSAKVVVCVAADFMNDFPLSAQYTTAYGSARKPEGKWMSKHFQFESIMSLAGSNADVRRAIKPSEEGLVLASIYNHITGQGSSNATSNITKGAAEALKAVPGESLVICGNNDIHCQNIAVAINEALGNIGNTIQKDKTVQLAVGDGTAFASLVSKMNSGAVDVLMMHGVNPAYDSPMAEEFKTGLGKVTNSFSFSSHADETASLCAYIMPSNHALESWNDHHVVSGHYALSQPCIQPLYDTRQYQGTLLAMSAKGGTYYDFIKSTWAGMAQGDATAFWNNALHNGSVDMGLQAPVVAAPVTVKSATQEVTAAAPTNTSGSVSTSIAAVEKTAASASGIEVVLYTKQGIGTGAQATNPWLQELPDPITKVCWDNYITMSPAQAKEMGFTLYMAQETPASVATVEVNGKKVTLPVVPVPGQKAGTVGIALGYGRGANGEHIGNAAFQTKEYGGYDLDDSGNKKPIGANAYALVAMVNGMASYTLSGATVTGTGEEYAIASTQTHHTIMDRESVLKETVLGTFKNGEQNDYNRPHTLKMHEHHEVVDKPIKEVDLWDPHPVEGIGHWWGLSIDLSSCLGCGACITACHSENNVPVVGKDEVRRSRDMHWLRIDRYFTSDMTKEKGEAEGIGTIDMYSKMEIPSENPSVVHMPMMCQHCNHAPCETVCPVAATTHSSEGLNQMTYNRCIGTRYCANNCPYKVRRFNWFNYKAYAKFSEVNPSQDMMGRMVLNPDVTVRSRGVMEKCSMCVQRIQAGKLDSKIKGIPVADGSIETACSEACPNNCITFGDINDTGSKVHGLRNDKRAYLALEEVGTQPSINYMVKVRNREETLA
jgi:MoCo/4Fe-4S cofactor protein with predicted Tat translocation signal